MNIEEKAKVICELSEKFDNLSFNLVFYNGVDGYVDVNDNSITSLDSANQLYDLIDYLAIESNKIEVMGFSTGYRYKSVTIYIDEKAIKEADKTRTLWS